MQHELLALFERKISELTLVGLSKRVHEPALPNIRSLKVQRIMGKGSLSCRAALAAF